jgi:hypothetical protein
VRLAPFEVFVANVARIMRAYATVTAATEESAVVKFAETISTVGTEHYSRGSHAVHSVRAAIKEDVTPPCVAEVEALLRDPGSARYRHHGWLETIVWAAIRNAADLTPPRPTPYRWVESEEAMSMFGIPPEQMGRVLAWFAYAKHSTIVTREDLFADAERLGNYRSAPAGETDVCSAYPMTYDGAQKLREVDP